MTSDKVEHADARPRRSFATSLALKICIALLMVDSVIELSFISSMVAWLNRTVTQNDFLFNLDGATHPLSGVPENLLVDQGHTSNGAAGTAFVLVGIGGIAALVLRRASEHRGGGFGVFARYFYYLWVVLNIPALMLTVGALGYVFSVTSARRGQAIDAELAAGLDGRAYPLDSWTPQNWFPAVLQLDLAERRDEILGHVYVMRGWQYNLIPLFLIQLGETVLAVWDCIGWRRSSKRTAYNHGY